MSEDNKEEPVNIESETAQVDVVETKSDDTSPVYEQIREIVSNMTDDDKKKTFQDALFFFMNDPKTVADAIVGMKLDKLIGTTEENVKYEDALRRCFTHHPPTTVNVNPFNNESSHWRQAVEHDGDEIMSGRPRFSKSGKNLSGENALLRVRAAAGLGTIVNVPLWHTGIWLKLKAPSDSTLLELERRISLEKITLGRTTVGVAFTNIAVYINTFLTDMILNHVYDGTYKDLSPKALKSIIKVTDIPQLVWGMASAIWPNGYRLVRPCVSDPTSCNHTDEAHISVSKLSWVDNRAISKSQRNLMVNRDGNVSDEDLKTYKEAHIAPQTKLIKINDDMSLRLTVPTIAEYELCGFRWVDDIVKMADEAFGQSLRGKERDDYITQQGAMTGLRRYSHWVKEVVFTEDDAVANERESIDEALDGLSSDDAIRRKILDEIELFMRSSIVSAIGIPRYDCPACGKGPDKEDLPLRLQEIIQVEPNEVFFTLQYMQVMRILQND